MIVDPGLCRSCRHSRQVPGTRTTFWMCERSATDTSFPRYPRLPVIQCRGYEPAGAKPDATEGPRGVF